MTVSCCTLFCCQYYDTCFRVEFSLLQPVIIHSSTVVHLMWHASSGVNAMMLHTVCTSVLGFCLTVIFSLVTKGQVLMETFQHCQSGIFTGLVHFAWVYSVVQKCCRHRLFLCTSYRKICSSIYGNLWLSFRMSGTDDDCGNQRYSWNLQILKFIMIYNDTEHCAHTTVCICVLCSFDQYCCRFILFCLLYFDQLSLV